MFTTYVQSIGLPELASQGQNPGKRKRLLPPLSKTSQPSPLEANQLFSYPVPKLSPDGSCSIIEEQAAEPYHLATILKVTSKNLENTPQAKALSWLQRCVDEVQHTTGVDWLGVYQKRENPDGQEVLVKMAYHGRISRAEFPLTKAFAATSNNATVGLSGKAVYFQDLSQYTGPYYECDTAVKSEFCLPILDHDKNVLGIIDAESFHTGFFTHDVLLTLSRFSWELSKSSIWNLLDGVK